MVLIFVFDQSVGLLWTDWVVTWRLQCATDSIKWWIVAVRRYHYCPRSIAFDKPTIALVNPILLTSTDSHCSYLKCDRLRHTPIQTDKPTIRSVRICCAHANWSSVHQPDVVRLQTKESSSKWDVNTARFWSTIRERYNITWPALSLQ